MLSFLSHNDAPALSENKSRAFVLCAGKGDRWSNYLGVPKQLIAFNGEPLVGRTARLLRKNGINDIVCVARDPQISIDRATSFSPRHFNYLVETLLSTASEWNTRTIILLGDVFFTKSAMRKVAGFDGELAVFGRPWASSFAKCNHGELFAMNFSSTVATRIIKAAEEVRKLAYAGARGNLWDLYHTLARLPLNSGRAETSLFRVIDDLTNDFDKPDDYIRGHSRYNAATSQSLILRFGLALLLIVLLPSQVLSRRPVVINPHRPTSVF